MSTSHAAAKLFFEKAREDSALMQELMDDPITTLQKHGVALDAVPEEAMACLSSAGMSTETKESIANNSIAGLA